MQHMQQHNKVESGSLFKKHHYLLKDCSQKHLKIPHGNEPVEHDRRDTINPK